MKFATRNDQVFCISWRSWRLGGLGASKLAATKRLRSPLRAAKLSRFKQPHSRPQRKRGVGDSVSSRDCDVNPDDAQWHRAGGIGEFCPLHSDLVINREAAQIEGLQVR